MGCRKVSSASSQDIGSMMLAVHPYIHPVFAFVAKQAVRTATSFGVMIIQWAAAIARSTRRRT